MDDIVKRLQGSLKYDAFNGSYNERAICISQVEEAITLIDSLRAERDEIREACAWVIEYLEGEDFIPDSTHFCTLDGYDREVTYDDLRKLAKLIGREKV